MVSETDLGIYDALNKGIQRSTGDIIGFLHADDIYASADILTKIASIFEDPSISAVYGDLQYVQKGNLNKVVRTWRSSRFERRLLIQGWMPPHPTLYVRRNWYFTIGGFDTNYRISADYLSILNLFSQKNFISSYLPEVFIKMRTGGVSNRSFLSILQKSREDLQALRDSGVGGIYTLL